MAITVKGTVLTDLVKIVRKERQLGWDDYLQPEDWDIINGDILATQWYPGDFFTGFLMPCTRWSAILI